jgi:hypothetical protein
MSKLAVITNLAIIIFFTAGHILGQVNEADPSARKVEKINCLQTVEKTLPPGVEKDFFHFLKKSEAEHLDLLEALGLIRDKVLQLSGIDQCQGQKVLYPEGTVLMPIFRPRLFWETTVVSSNDSFRLLFFQETPVYNSRPKVSCLIAKTDINYKLRSWITSGCYQNFIKASIENEAGGVILKLVGNTFSDKDLRISRYQISSKEIAEIPPNN